MVLVAAQKHVHKFIADSIRPIQYLIDYWRKRASGHSCSESEKVIMNMTADALEGEK